MANVAVYNMKGKEVGSLELNDAVFGVEVNEHLVHMAVLQQLANNRQGTQKAKTRSEVRGGGRNIVGVICGCYSSVCIAGCLWYDLKNALDKRKAKKTSK